MPYFAVMAAAMGLQQLKAWQDNKQKEVFAEKQKEMRIALQNREFERMRRIQAEAQQLALEMEREAHEQRRLDIENEYDNLFDSLADQFQLDKWPLNIVPFIMKGESFGSRVRGNDVAAIHCVLTPSNNMDFNRYVYNKLDIKIEHAMNLYWNSNTTHTVVYYGSTWKLKTPSGIPRFDYNDVERLYADLHNVPFICITPYFRESNGEFYFKVWVWGMGANVTENKKDVFLPEGLISEPLNHQFDFSQINAGSINELASYVTSLVGFLSDMYYWKMYNLPPMCLPLNSSIVPYNQLKSNLIDDYYNVIIDTVTEESLNIIKINNVLSYHSKIEPYLDKDSSLEFIDKIYAHLLDSRGVDANNIHELSYILEDDDIQALEIIASHSDKYDFLDSVIEDSKNQIACNTISLGSTMSVIDILIFGYDWSLESNSNCKIQFNIGDKGTFIALLDSYNEPINDRVNPKCVYIEYENLIPTDRIRIQNNSFILSIQQLKNILTKFSAI